MLRNRFTYSNVVATLALVFAMSGGAYAASKFLITSTKQIKPSVLASLKGKAGANGAPGATGPAGPAGPAGGVGTQGPAGTAGTNGTPGTEGKEGKAGKNGANGAAGSPWTANGTLPVGSTETGVWAMGPVSTGAGLTELKTAISFMIPLAKPIDNPQPCGGSGLPACLVHIFEGTNIPPGCTGSVVEGERVTELKAASGNFCVWIRPFSSVKEDNLDSSDIETAEVGVGTHGATLVTQKALGEGSKGEGLWAVTG